MQFKLHKSNFAHQINAKGETVRSQNELRMLLLAKKVSRAVVALMLLHLNGYTRLSRMRTDEIC
ncbi:hypothetical protein Osc7112_1450 [Oscillatoria nigro-viridis PCC 7112]|uniref:Uncharacterized protein n=1 Tax=Phormidium nigroviride PCC 7112 TaxID=179408 RepID=K9VEP5_9CYAN|nr:hypothetical protein Osc7112_1450 [Oscillatoria nigro-viridis PCC 7112]